MTEEALKELEVDYLAADEEYRLLVASCVAIELQLPRADSDLQRELVGLEERRRGVLREYNRIFGLMRGM